MRIAHIAPWAVNRCGLYEMARDMARADFYGGNEVIFIDAGVTENGVRQEPVIGAIDERAGFRLQTADYKLLETADVIILHTGVPDNWLVKNQIPLIWVVHGRPLACFRPELMKKGSSYSLYWEVSGWQRTKKMLYFWPEFNSHWKPLFNGKDLCLDYPLIDETRFSHEGQKHKLANHGKYNILVCDSQREDIDLYEMVVGLLIACEKIPGLKIHFYGFDMPLPNCWNILLGKLKEFGGLGDIAGRVSNMELIYRSCDCLISPNTIITRTIGEALSCGIPVISNINRFNMMSDYTCNMADPEDICEAIQLFVNDFDNKLIDKNTILNRAKNFNMENYSKKMNKVYEELV
jgi:glycosyltransferase involved in cell wall biosynthesis